MDIVDDEDDPAVAFNPAIHRARDATPLRRIIAARQRMEAAERELADAVAAARAAGDSWPVIGAALDTGAQAARQRFGSPAETAAAAPVEPHP
ncbi:hypothetical protein V6N00_13850 [Tersicoccus sp. MR15.9]|uniref:hypothetical protein n=1 Tax=Tersicoccus mangrovi TaxID=3121635 RepID=UPI002FE6326E